MHSPRIYRVSYFEKNQKTKERRLLGTRIVDDANTNLDDFPFLRKAMLHAPAEAKHANVLKIEQINSRATSTVGRR